MLRGYRLAIIALGLTLFVGAAGLEAQPLPQEKPIIGVEHDQKDAADGNGDAGQHEREPDEPGDGLPLKIDEADNAVGANAIAEKNTDYPDCEFHTVDECDLAAQQSMAKSTWWMNVAAWGGFSLTAVGVLLLLGTLIYTARAAASAKLMVVEAEKTTAAARGAVREARDANIATKAMVTLSAQTAERQLRPYIHFVEGELTVLQGANGWIRGSGFVKFKNFGATSALVVRMRHGQWLYEVETNIGGSGFESPSQALGANQEFSIELRNGFWTLRPDEADRVRSLHYIVGFQVLYGWGGENQWSDEIWLTGEATVEWVRETMKLRQCPKPENRGFANFDVDALFKRPLLSND